VGDVGEPVPFRKILGPSIESWAGDLDGVAAQTAHQVMVVLPGAPQVHRLVAVLPVQDVQGPDLDHAREVPVDRGQADALAARKHLMAEATDVVLRYGSHTALARSSFTVPMDGVTAVIGPNGSGKSTLLHALAGLVPVSEGRLQVLGRDPQQARAGISYVLQSTVVPHSTPITVREAVGMGRYPSVGFFRRFSRVDHARVADAMHRMEIEDLAGRHLHELSGGQRQRVYVAQGLAQDHRVMLLDEPLTGLDIVSARTIDRLIHGDGPEGRTVVLTTHDLEEARAADHVILVSGRVVADGPPASVCNRHNVEEAFGLGGLHGWEGFLDDPAHDPHREGHA